jgi:geranylgeranyl pyrophosphate synthase
MTIETQSSADAFPAYVQARREEIDAALRAWLPQPPACPPIVAEAIRYSIDAGGKRLRPILALAAAEAVAVLPDKMPDAARSPGEARRLALPSGCAIEFIHTYSLIHDDLPAMDDDTMRRGRPTLHVVYGAGIAILAGDALQADAFALLAREPQTSGVAPGGRAPLADLQARKLRVIERIGTAAGALGMVGGQAIDLESAGTTEIPGRPRPTLTADGLRAMHAMKTGALIRAAAVSGAIMAGGSDAQVDAVDRFAADLGLAFQIVDDILDVEGAVDALGKTVGKDAAADKPTYPALFGLEASRRLAADATGRAETALAEAGLASSRLLDIANWVVKRQS